MTKKTDTPAIRFKGFSDTWEQRKLGEIFKYEQPQAYIVESTEYDNKNKIPVLTAGQSFILGYTDEQFGIKQASEESPVIIFDDFTTSSHYVNFPFKVKSSAMKLLTLNNPKNNIHCAYNILQNIGFVPVSHERHWISTFAKFEVLLPKSADEQKKIGSYFANLDQLITLHQRKYEKLHNIKKSMLEKMFPKNGSNVPEIRFKGFTEAWEQRKLGDNIIEYTETTTKNNQYPPLTSSRKGIFLQTEYFAGNQIASDDNTGYNIVPYGYFTYRHMSDDEIFHFNINDIVQNGIVSTLYPVFTTDENLDSRYLQYQLNYGYEFAKFAILQKQGGSRTYMYLNKLKQLYLTMPKSVEEQNAISAFFMSLDHLITLHQRELEKLQNIKKSMLEKMFV